ncbi:hypothetical protein DIPPA_24611 [Diplonema papillatum]|nr:hypothetical protein DIPPA_24611 [Diplonema papillatum]
MIRLGLWPIAAARAVGLQLRFAGKKAGGADRLKASMQRSLEASKDAKKRGEAEAKRHRKRAENHLAVAKKAAAAREKKAKEREKKQREALKKLAAAAKKAKAEAKKTTARIRREAKAQEKRARSQLAAAERLTLQLAAKEASKPAPRAKAGGSPRSRSSSSSSGSGAQSKPGRRSKGGAVLPRTSPRARSSPDDSVVRREIEKEARKLLSLIRWLHRIPSCSSSKESPAPLVQREHEHTELPGPVTAFACFLAKRRCRRDLDASQLRIVWKNMSPDLRAEYQAQAKKNQAVWKRVNAKEGPPIKADAKKRVCALAF